MYWSSAPVGMFTRDYSTILVMTESLCKDWHMTSSQGSEQCNKARLLPTYHTGYTITIHDVTSWHTDRTPTTVLVTSYNWEYINQQFNNFDMTWPQQAIKISSLVAHWHSDSCTSSSHLISNYSTVVVQKQQECNCQRWWMQVTCSLQQVLKSCLEVTVVYWNVLQM